MKRTILSLLLLMGFTSNTIAQISYEAGIGTNYGGIVGVTFNSELNSNIEMFAGLGSGFETLTYVVGSKYWLNEQTRIIGNYGYNCTVKTVSTSTTYKDYYGLNFGIGYSFGGKNSNGVAIDLMLLDTSDCHNAVGSSEPSSAIRIALGYRF